MLPPHLKRLFTSSPTFGVLLLLALCFFIYAFLPFSSPLSRTFPSGPQSDTYGYPPSSGTSHNRSPDTTPELDNKRLALPRLSSHYDSLLQHNQLTEVFDTPILRPLAKRLHAFLERPGFDREQAKATNEAACPLELSDKLVNPDQRAGDGEFWDQMGAGVIAQKRAGVVKWLEERIKAGDEVVANAQSGEGKGIVLTGGNQDTTLRLIHVMKHLQHLGTNLPIEVFHYPDELHDEGQRKEIESLGGRIVKIKGVEKQKGVWKNWQIKGLALVQSSFREVLYLDSDNTPLRDPSHLFTAPLYLDQGRAVFWPDLSKDHPHNAIWRLVGKPCTLKSWTFESGQILVDKAGNRGMNLAALLIAAGMQEERDFWFRMCGGDKDTFRWGWEVLGLTYGESPRWMSMLGFENAWNNGRFCGHSVLQYDLVIPDGFTREPPLFVHSNLLKIFSGRDLTLGKLFTHVKRVNNDQTHLPALNHAHAFVYDAPARGMCLDLELHESASTLSPADQEALHIQHLSVNDEEGGVFDGFEKAWFDFGGRVGGWN